MFVFVAMYIHKAHERQQQQQRWAAAQSSCLYVTHCDSCFLVVLFTHCTFSKLFLHLYLSHTVPLVSLSIVWKFPSQFVRCTLSSSFCGAKSSIHTKLTRLRVKFKNKKIPPPSRESKCEWLVVWQSVVCIGELTNKQPLRYSNKLGPTQNPLVVENMDFYSDLYYWL